MSNTVTSSTKPRRATYTFKVVVEPDDDVWQAYCPALKAYGAVTTREKALQHIREVVEMVVTELREDGEAHSRRVRFRGGHAGLRHRMSDVDWSRLRLQISRQRRA